MSWIDYALSLLFPPPVSVRIFDRLPRPIPHNHESWILSATRYRSDARKIIRYLKSTPDKLFLNHCALKMAEVIESYILEQNLVSSCEYIHITPVPQHKKTDRARGFSQSALLAQAICNHLSYTHYSPILCKTRATEKQALLPKHRRLTNQLNAYQCSTSTRSANELVILVDDVSTTGNTLRECRKVLLNAGYTHVIGIVFAH